MMFNKVSRAASAVERPCGRRLRGPTWLVVGSLLQAGGLGCGSPDHAPSIADRPSSTDDGGPGAGGVRGHGGSSSRDSGADIAAAGSGGAAGEPDASVLDGGADGAPTDAGCSVKAYETPPSATGTGVCKMDSAWGTGALVATASTPDDDVFGSVSDTEQTLAWMSVVNGVPTLRYADRGSPDLPFNPAGNIAIAGAYYAAERPALSHDGTRLVVVRADGKGFGEYTRTALYGSFTGTASEASFAALNAQGDLFASDERFGDPQLSSDDRTLYYSKYDSRSRQTVYAVTRTAGGSWSVGSPVEGAPLMGSCGRRMHPTGISSDQLSLFYWDEVTQTERVTFRSAVGAPFAGVIDLGAHPHAQPNATCQRLYYSAPGEASALEDIAVASR
ncbi:MAG TPA: hypothetical protein VF395_02160 [Polyangiaceae bacterium]